MNIISIIKYIFFNKEYNGEEVRKINKFEEEYRTSLFTSFSLRETNLVEKYSTIDEFINLQKKILLSQPQVEKPIAIVQRQQKFPAEQKAQRFYPSFEKYEKYEKIENLKSKPWRVSFNDEFFKNLEKVDNKMRGRLWKIIKDILKNPIENSGNTIKELKGDLKNKWRARCGDYRLVYLPDRPNNVVVFLYMKHRKDVYNFVL